MRLIDADALEKYIMEIMPNETFSAYGKGVLDILTHLLYFVRNEMPTTHTEPPDGGDSDAWCKIKEQSVVQVNGNAAHRNGQWLIPCGRDMRGYKGEKDNG